MNATVTIAQAKGLRRVAADLTHEFRDFLSPHGSFDGSQVAGYAIAAPILRALAVELALKAISIKSAGTCLRSHNLVELFDELDEDMRSRIDRRGESILLHSTCPSIRSILANHQNDFTSWRYLGENPRDLAPSGKDLHAALDTLIATYEEIWGFDP